MSVEKTIEELREIRPSVNLRNWYDSKIITATALHELADGYEAKEAEVAELRKALGHYADPMNWICCQPSYLHNCSEDKCWMTQYEGDGQGWDVAKAILDKIRG